MSTTAQSVTATVLAISAVLALLVIGKDLLLPFAVAVIIWYVIDALSDSLARIRFNGHFLFSRISLLLSLLIIVSLLIGVVDMIGETVVQVKGAAPSYQNNISNTLDKLTAYTGVEFAPAIKSMAAHINIGIIIGNIATALMSLAGNAGMVAIYVMFLLIEQRYFDVKMLALFSNSSKYNGFQSVVNHIQRQIRHYMYLKTLLSAATGLISYLILLAIGVDYAEFWALLTFLLNFIPTIGSLLGVLFPALLTLVQFDSFTPFLLLLVGLGSIQFLIGNVLEPRLMGSSLNLSPLIVILSLSLWGEIWGVTGMFLSVPLTVIAMIILAHFPQTRGIAIILSENGVVESKMAGSEIELMLDKN